MPTLRSRMRRREPADVVRRVRHRPLGADRESVVGIQLEAGAEALERRDTRQAPLVAFSGFFFAAIRFAHSASSAFTSSAFSPRQGRPTTLW